MKQIPNLGYGCDLDLKIVLQIIQGAQALVGLSGFFYRSYEFNE
jgi:hypothetical protein